MRVGSHARSLYERRLPTNLQSFARGDNWVITGDHYQDFQKITNHVARPPNPLDPLHLIRQPKVNTKDVVNNWLDFDGSKDISLHSMYSDALYPPLL